MAPMSSLQDILLADDTRPRVVEDCVALVDHEVAAKSGLSGMAIKGAYALVKKIKPSIIQEAVNHLLNDFVQDLSPFYDSFEQGSFVSHLEAQRPDVASALLGVTDRRIENAKNKTIKKAYQKLRPTGQTHVAAAVPGLAEVVQKYI